MPLDWEWTNDRGVWGAQATDGGAVRAIIVALPGGVWGWAVWRLSRLELSTSRRISVEAETAAVALTRAEVAVECLAANDGH
jgi:hypothetical protein